MGKALKVHVAGSSTDAETLRWALSLDAELIDEPAQANVRVVVDGAVAPQRQRPRQKFVVLASPELMSDIEWLQCNVLWLIRDDGEARRLARSADIVKMAKVGWSSPEHVRRKPYKFKLPMVALGNRASRTSVPAKVAVAVEEDEPATLLVAPTDAASVYRALHRGIPILDFPRSPLRWALIPGHDSLIRRSGAQLVAQVLRDHDTLRRLTCPQPGELEARRDRFLREVRHRVLGIKPKTIFFVRKQTVNPQFGTRKRFDTVQEFGFDTRVVHIDQLKQPHDMVLLGGRVQHERIREIAAKSGRPIVLAMNDAICDAERRNWFKVAARHLKAAFISDPPELAPRVGCRVVQLHQAPQNVESSRFGGIMRHPEVPRREDERGPAVLFLAHHWYTRRVQIVKALAEVEPMHVYGNNVPPIPNVHRGDRKGPRESMDLMRRARVTLSTSISNDRELTSVRLFNAAAVGGHVLAEWFPGCENIYPEGIVRYFRSINEGKAVLAEMLATPFEKEREIRWQAMEYTWRRYSFHDRVRTILRVAQEELGIELLPLGC